MFSYNYLVPPAAVKQLGVRWMSVSSGAAALPPLTGIRLDLLIKCWRLQQIVITIVMNIVLLPVVCNHLPVIIPSLLASPGYLLPAALETFPPSETHSAAACGANLPTSSLVLCNLSKKGITCSPAYPRSACSPY